MRLYVLDYGALEVDKGNLLTPGHGVGEWVTIGVPGFLIRSDDGSVIAVDSGLPAAYLEDPTGAAIADGFGDVLRVRASADNGPVAQLATIGLTPGDVTHHVITHTHFDHAGGIAGFPRAVHVVHRAERALARPVYAGVSWPQGVTCQIVEGDTELCRGVQLLSTPGHTPGHLSLLVDLPKTGPMLLAIDALYLPDVLELDDFRASWNVDMARESGRRVAALADDRGARLIYGHDPAQWETLRRAPAFYE